MGQMLAFLMNELDTSGGSRASHWNYHKSIYAYMVRRWLVRFTDLSPLTVAKHGEMPAHVAAAQWRTSCLKVRAMRHARSY